MRLMTKVSRILIVFVVASVLCSQQTSAQDDGYSSTLISILSEKIQKEQINGEKPVWTVTVIGVRAFEKDEILFGLVKYKNNDIKLVRVKPKSGSVYTQRERLWKKEGAAPVSRINVTASAVDGKVCAELSRIAERWEKLTVPLIPENVLMLDATGYTVTAEGLYGDSSVIRFDAGDFEHDRSSPLMILIKDTWSKCSAIRSR